jgi:hypothetical protein
MSKVRHLAVFWVLLLAFMGLSQAVSAQDGQISVLKIAGKAEILERGRSSTAREGQRLYPGQSVRLIGGGEVSLSSQDGRIKIKVQDNTTVTYDGEVGINIQPWSKSGPGYRKTTVKEDPMAPQFSVPVGKLEVEVQPGQELRMVMPLIMAAVRGTFFTVNVQTDGTSVLSTLEGAVATYGRHGDMRLTMAGQSAEVTARAYADYLSAKGVSVPPGGTWQDVPASIQESVDNETLGNIFVEGGGDLLAAVLANPEASPAAGINALAIEASSEADGALFVDSSLGSSLGVGSGGSGQGGQDTQGGQSSTQSSESPGGGFGAGAGSGSMESTLLAQGLPELVPDINDLITFDRRHGHVSGSFVLPGAVTVYENKLFFGLDFGTGAISDAGFLIEYQRPHPSYTTVLTSLSAYGGSGQLNANILQFSLGSFVSSNFREDLNASSAGYGSLGSGTSMTGSLGAMDFNQPVNGALNLAYRTDSSSPAIADMPSYLSFAGTLKEMPVLDVTGSFNLDPSLTVMQNSFSFQLDPSDGSIFYGRASLRYSEPSLSTFAVNLAEGSGVMSGHNFGLDFNKGTFYIGGSPLVPVVFTIDSPGVGINTITVNGAGASLTIDTFRGRLEGTFDKPLAEVEAGSLVTGGRLEVTNPDFTLVSYPTYAPVHLSVGGGQAN